MYCKSTQYGPGCPISPHGIHVHPNDSKKCIYCSSYSIGAGCPYNPFNNIHVHGVDFNQMVRDSVEHTITAGYLIKRLSESIEDTAAFKNGIIDINGNKIKEPVTIEEKASYTTLDSYILSLRGVVGPKIDLVNGALYLEKQDMVNVNDYHTLYENEMKFTKRIKKTIKEFNTIISEAYQNGLSTTTIEKNILDQFIGKK